MKKIKASLIKRLLKINSQPFVSSFFELSLSLFYLSHTIAHLRVSLDHYSKGGTRKQREVKIRQ